MKSQMRFGVEEVEEDWDVGGESLGYDGMDYGRYSAQREGSDGSAMHKGREDLNVGR